MSLSKIVIGKPRVTQAFGELNDINEIGACDSDTEKKSELRIVRIDD